MYLSLHFLLKVVKILIIRVFLGCMVWSLIPDTNTDYDVRIEE